MLRYAVSALRTIKFLYRTRPQTVIVTVPPAPAAALVSMLAKLLGATLVLDSHPGAFGALGDRNSRWFVPVLRILVRRAAVCLVAAPVWQEVVESWGGRALVFHEAPGGWGDVPARRHDPLRVLCVGRLAPDEPTSAVVDAARLAPTCEVLITGDRDRLDAAALAAAPENCHFVGFLEAQKFRAAVEDCDVVLSLSTDPGSVMRSAYEAVYARRPLIVSDWPISAEVFPNALRCVNEAVAIAGALRRADATYADLVLAAEPARRVQVERWECQLADLAALMRGATRRRRARGRRAAGARGCEQ